MIVFIKKYKTIIMALIWNFLKKKNNLLITVIILLILGLGSTVYFQGKKINNLNDKYLAEVKLKNALIDSVHIYQNKDSLWVAEKLTIQAKIKDLEDNEVQLTEEQKRLIAKVKEADKENDVITAALIQANFVIDSLKHTGGVVVDTTKKTVQFTEVVNPNINYDFTAFGVLPYPINTKPTMLINHLALPNEQFIKFQWNEDKRAGYPISFSVSNTNEYVKVYDVNSYAIPELNKEIINPTGWQKVGQWFKRNGKIVKYAVIGGVAGAGGTYILMK